MLSMLLMFSFLGRLPLIVFPCFKAMDSSRLSSVHHDISLLLKKMGSDPLSQDVAISYFYKNDKQKCCLQIEHGYVRKPSEWKQQLRTETDYFMQKDGTGTIPLTGPVCQVMTRGMQDFWCQLQAMPDQALHVRVDTDFDGGQQIKFHARIYSMAPSEQSQKLQANDQKDSQSSSEKYFFCKFPIQGSMSEIGQEDSVLQYHLRKVSREQWIRMGGPADLCVFGSKNVETSERGGSTAAFKVFNINCYSFQENVGEMEVFIWKLAEDPSGSETNPSSDTPQFEGAMWMQFVLMSTFSVFFRMSDFVCTAHASQSALAVIDRPRASKEYHKWKHFSDKQIEDEQ